MHLKNSVDTFNVSMESNVQHWTIFMGRAALLHARLRRDILIASWHNIDLHIEIMKIDKPIKKWTKNNFEIYIS